MIWIALSEKDTDNAALQKRLWDAAEQFRANSGLKSQEYSARVIGLIFPRFSEVRFAAQRAKLEKAIAFAQRGSRVDGLGATDAFELQHGFGEMAHGGVRNFRWEWLRDAAFQFVQLRVFGFAEA